MFLSKSSRASAALLLLLLPAAAARSAPERTEVITTRHFVIEYLSADARDARRVAEYAENAIAEVGRSLGYDSELETIRSPIRVYSSRPAFETKAGPVVKKKRIVGRTWSGTEQIEIDASGAYAIVQQVVDHEVTHLIVARILGRNMGALPLWANEGIAQTMSRESSQVDDDAVGEAIGKGQFIPLEELDARFPSDNQQTTLAYAEGVSFLRFLCRKYGQDIPRKLLWETASTGSFDQAVMNITGESLDKLKVQWRNSVSKTFLSGWLARNLSLVLGAAMALLCIIAYAAIRAKRHRYEIDWARDEWDDGLDYGEPPE